MAEGVILLVEDDASVLVTMQAILEDEGYAVTAAGSGLAALALLGERSFDLVLTDLRLDDVDGLTVLAEVRRTAPDTNTILLTGYASLESAIKALQEGAYAYLVKPCDVEELKVTLARAMERRRLALQLRDRVRDLEDANATIRSLNAGLEERVAAATAELAEQNANLAQARDEIAALYEQARVHVEQLQELDRLKSQFLSMAAHELKTPLTSIYGYLQIAQRRAGRRLERGYPGEEDWRRESAADVQQWDTLTQQTRRLGRLVDELLDVTRIQSGRLEFQTEPVDLAALVADVAGRMQLTTDRHKLVVQAGVAGCTVTGDRDRLEQVLTNLIGNAIKYSPDGGPITVALNCAGDQAVVRVQDRGLGVPPTEHEAVFELFYRSPDARTRQAGGMGLGLYISREIVRRHGGDIWVESEPGSGSTFAFGLPTVAAANPAVATAGD